VSILTSTLKRTINTAAEIDIPGVKPISLKVLDEINAGVCETLTYDEIQKKYP
jgi:6-phosphofructo-2-kinase/fructose-2,6-biphosphatase 2